MKINPSINIDSFGNAYYYGKDKIRTVRREKKIPYNTTVVYEFEKIFISKEAQYLVFKMNPFALSKCWQLGLDPSYVAEQIIDQKNKREFDLTDKLFFNYDLPFMQLPDKRFVYTYSAKSDTIIDIDYK